MKHLYYRLILRLCSPLSVGSGSNRCSGHDVMMNQAGIPFIPASAIAGVLRHFYAEILRGDADALFGTINSGNKESKLFFYDAALISDADSVVTSVRDSVKLQNKIPKDGAKFDFQIVETGAEFVTYLELRKEGEAFAADVERLIAAMRAGLLRFGHKTSRGYGEIAVTEVKKATFDLPNDTEAFLDFDLFSDSAWESIDVYSIAEENTAMDTISLSLRQNGALSIRTYTTEVSKEKGVAMPDFKQLTLRNGVPVIPGTSWAGMLRERYQQFAGDIAANEMFGYVDEKTRETQKSKIIISESQITNFQMKKLSRSSIDRFSGGTKDGALYTELTCYNGTTELKIRIPKNTTPQERTILGAVLLDLHHGYLALGGLTSIGRGCFTVTEIQMNGESRMDLLLADNAKDLLKGGEEND